MNLIMLDQINEPIKISIREADVFGFIDSEIALWVHEHVHNLANAGLIVKQEFYNGLGTDQSAFTLVAELAEPLPLKPSRSYTEPPTYRYVGE